MKALIPASMTDAKNRNPWTSDFKVAVMPYIAAFRHVLQLISTNEFECSSEIDSNHKVVYIFVV